MKRGPCRGGWQDMDASGAVGRWQVEGGYIRAEYVTMEEPSAKAQYDQEVYQLHAERGDSWGGGDAAGLDYFPREKASFEGHPMPGEVKALYLNSESVAQAAEYVEVADSCGINAFVVDIMDGGAIAYPSEVMKQYSPSAYESAYNTLEVYQTGIKTLKDAGYYVIGRITAFNDPHLAEDHPECVIADQAGEPLQIGGMYWPSVYSRFVWQYKVELGLEAARLMGFDEIQFDYMRFPDGTWAFEEGTIDYRNENGESKAQAVQRFLMYACDRLHDAGVYVSGLPSAMWWTPSAPCPIRITTGPPGTGYRGSTPTRPCMPSARRLPSDSWRRRLRLRYARGCRPTTPSGSPTTPTARRR